MITWNTDNAVTHRWPLTTRIEGQELSLTVAPWDREAAIKIGERLTKLKVVNGERRFELIEGDEVLGTAYPVWGGFHLEFGDRKFGLFQDPETPHRYAVSEGRATLGEIEIIPHTFAASRTTSTVSGVPTEVHAMTVALLVV
ncbi:MAG: hypothetical protein AAGN66_05295 [Acidobacteriota bacterium]